MKKALTSLFASTVVEWEKKILCAKEFILIPSATNMHIAQGYFPGNNSKIHRFMVLGFQKFRSVFRPELWATKNV